MNKQTAPRVWTEDEVRDKFLQHVAVMTRYWERESRVTTAREKLEGLAFSILAALDGSSAAIPGFVVAPAPHKDDRAFHIGEGENYYPKAPKVECDIAGGLHELIHKVLRDTP